MDESLEEKYKVEQFADSITNMEECVAAACEYIVLGRKFLEVARKEPGRMDGFPTVLGTCLLQWNVKHAVEFMQKSLGWKRRKDVAKAIDDGVDLKKAVVKAAAKAIDDGEDDLMGATLKALGWEK